MTKKKGVCKTLPNLSTKKKRNYLTCRTSSLTRARLEKVAKLEKRSVSNLVCIVIEAWLDDNEIED